MDHARSQLFYRCFSTTSAGQLQSGRYYEGHPTLSGTQLLHEFQKHYIRRNTQPTALVSVTNRPLEAVNRALAKYYHSDELPETIWVAIIRVPGGENYNRPHHAKKLAQQSHIKNADLFKYEYLFEWEIPLEYVEHRVSVRTLLNRDIEKLLGLQHFANDFPCFRYMQETLVCNILESHPYAAGRWLGSLAQAFGARTCTYELAFQILRTILDGGRIDGDGQFVRFGMLGSNGVLEFSDICAIEHGIREQLNQYPGI